MNQPSALLTAVFGTLVITAPALSEQRKSLVLEVSPVPEATCLGEMLVLGGALKNIGKTPITDIDAGECPDHGHIGILLSNDGQSFRRYESGIYPTGRCGHPTKQLKPGERWPFEVRVLYHRLSPQRLALDKSGRYYVKLRYPLQHTTIRTGEALILESNIMPIDVRSPKGRDAELWQQLRRDEFLYFLHSGIVRPGFQEIPRNAIALLRAHPGSAYDATLRQGLRQYYLLKSKEMVEPEEDPHMENLRALLRIPKQKGQQPLPLFPHDRRLDRKFTRHFRNQTPLDDVMSAVSAAARVPLRVAPELRTWTMASIETTETVRQFMQTFDWAGSVWILEADGGYRLVPRETRPKKP